MCFTRIWFDYRTYIQLRALRHCVAGIYHGDIFILRYEISMYLKYNLQFASMACILYTGNLHF